MERIVGLRFFQRQSAENQVVGQLAARSQLRMAVTLADQPERASV